MAARMTNRDKALALFKPDTDGYSDWVPVEHLASAGLNWGNNGNLRRGAAFSVKDIKWETKRLNPESNRSKVIALRMVGWADGDAFDQKINPEIRKSILENKYCNISMLPVPKDDKEVDHRFGFKEHPKYTELYKTENQKPEHFQLIHRVLNLQKRQMCVVCQESLIRPPHPELGFAEGDERLTLELACSGCYLAEPERFRNK